MLILKSLFLGFIQGVTEFLPISSSAHLVITERLIGIQPSFFLNVSMHAGTMVATIIVYRKTICEIIRGLFRRQENEIKYFSRIMLATIVSAAVAFLIVSITGEDTLNGKNLIGGLLAVTAAILFLSDRTKNTQPLSLRQISIFNVILIGLAQGIAVFPGISRSGITIASCLFMKMERSEATKFSFILSIPIILLALIYETTASCGDIAAGSYNLTGVLAGFFAALISGLIAIKLMIMLVKSRKLTIFAVYCILLGTALFLV
ncbi:MAG: undecaprenyl-diphosphate phosphatase [Candidatus Aureabacteria bacterium]|nr:undecaprenyl-diphosphate phosphatase [Candidatus Auribacterota bacterium]